MKGLVSVLMLIASVGYSAIQTAGDLLIDINASASAGAGNGTKLASITNSGTLGGFFVRATANEGALYTNNFGGVQHALWFNGNANTVMTNSLAVPAGLTGTTATYTIEAWVNNPVGSGEDIFSWTYRTATAPQVRLIELRAGDPGNAMEHHTTNVGWFNRMPANGTWFHVAVVRDGTTGLEKLYANGTLVGTATITTLNVLPDGIFILGGTQNGARTGFEQFLSGAVGAVRVHAGQLTTTQVINNYLEERNAYSSAAVWAGAAATELDWNTAGNWQSNNVGGAGDEVFIGNGGIAKLTSDTGTLSSLQLWAGGLNMTNDGATAAITVNSPIAVDVGQGGDFTLNIPEGTFQTVGSSAANDPALRLGYRNDGFTATANIGGSDDPALLLTQGRTVFVGDTDHALSPGAVTARLNLLANGSMIVSNNNLYVGNSGADGKITVDGGTLLVANSNPATRNYIIVSSNNGKGELALNSGEINTPGIGEIQVGNASATGEGILRVNGGKIYTSRLWTGGNTWNMKLYLNGGEIYNNVGQNGTDFIGQFKYAYIQAGGAKIVVPSGTTPIATQRFEHDPDLGGTADGGLTLSGGGMLTLSASTNTFTGPITISGGAALHLTHVDAFTNDGLPAITLDNGSIGWKKAGGFTNLLAKLTPGSTGSIVLYPENASENVDLTGYTNITVRFQGTFNYTGTITLDPSVTALIFTPENNAVVTYSPVLTGAQPIIVNGLGNGMVELAGDNNAWAGSIAVNGGRLSVSHVNGLGDGTGAITINSNAYLRINAAVASSFVSRITSGSNGYIILRAAAAALNIDLTNCPGVSLGTDEGTLNYTGTITPASDNVFRLGGGNTTFRLSGNQGLVANLVGGTDTVIQQGMARITNSTCTGSMILTNNGVLHLTTDAAFGVVPASPTANSIQLDTGGAIRQNGNVTLNANRGIVVGSGGGEMHTWGGTTFTIPGNLSGAGNLNFTDGGTTVFSGANNTYSGTMDIQQGSTIIGNGATFSWNTNTKVTGTGGTDRRFGVNANANLTWTTDMGAPLGSADLNRRNIGFRKQGAGMLTVDCAQQYIYNTDLEGGTLKVASSGAVPSGAGRGDVFFYNNATLDVNGNNLALNAVNNAAGRIIDSAGTATQITLGTDNDTWTLAAPITNSLAIIKTGTGTMTLAAPASRIDNAVRVDAGTISMPALMALDGSLNLNGTATTLSLTKGSFLGTNGLTAYYYYGVSGTAQIASYAVMQNRLATVVPSVITTSLVAGNNCDYDTTKLYNADTYTLLHHGRFIAETSGTYAFALSSDDGSTLCIDGTLLVDNNKDQGWTLPPQKTNTVYLAAGLHEVMMGMYENAGGQGLTLFYQAPSQSVLTPVPNNLLLQDIARVSNLIGTGKIEAIATTNVTPLELVANVGSTFSGSVVATQGIYIVKSGSAKQTMSVSAYPTSTVWEVRSGELEFTTQPNRGEVVVAAGATASLTPVTALGTGNGLIGRYYDNLARTTDANFTNLVAFKNYLAGFTPTHTFSTTYNGQTVLNFGNNGSGFPPPYNANSTFHTFWEGYIVIPQAGQYTFYTASDDGSALFIDGACIVNNNYLQGVTERSGTVVLSAGLHALAISYFDNGGGWGFYVNMEGPGMAKQYMPNSMLVPINGSVSGISGAGTYALNNASAHEILNDLTNRTFSGSLSGSSGTYLSKTGPATWTLAGNSSAFAGTLNILSGVVSLSGVASLGGTIVNNGGLALNVTVDRTFDMSAGGKGTLVKNEASTVTIKLNGASFDQQLTVNAGQVLFDNQGNDIVMTKQPIITGSGSWGVVGAGRLSMSATNTVSSTGSIKIDTGTLGLGTANPVIDGLMTQIDASRPNTLTLDGAKVTRWNSLVSGQAYTNAGANAPTYDATAFGGRGGVVFGAPGTETHLQSVLNQVGKTVIMVARFTDVQPGLGGVWGQTYNDKGIRAVGGMTTYSTPGDGNDYVQNGGKTFTNGFEMVTATNIGTTPHIAAFYAGNNGTWAGSISTTIGCYWYNSYPDRFYKGVIGEMIVYNRVITDAERLQVEEYLRLKWTDASSSIVNFLPEGASLSLTNNGTLNLGATTQTFGSITGAGTITNGHAIVTDDIRPGGDGVVGTLRFAGFAQQTATYYADLTQNVGAPCDTVIISGTGAVSLDGLTININPLAQPMSILKFKVMSTAGTFTGAPTLTGTTLYWSVLIGDAGKSLYLMYSSGTVLLFR